MLFRSRVRPRHPSQSPLRPHPRRQLSPHRTRWRIRQSLLPSSSLFLTPSSATRDHPRYRDISRQRLCPFGTPRPRLRISSNASSSPSIQTPHRLNPRSRCRETRRPPDRRVLFRPNARSNRGRREGEHGLAVCAGVFQLRADCYDAGELGGAERVRSELMVVWVGRVVADLCA